MTTQSPPTIPTIAEITLSYRPSQKPSERPVITTSIDAFKLFLDTWDRNTIELAEQFKVLLLNRANYVLGLYIASTGSTTGTVADPKLIFAVALKANASAILLAHNHPSGNATPSKSDGELTKKITHCGNLLDIKVLDHLIITTESYYSFAEQGLL